MTDRTRPYRSPLRDGQAQRTRGLILDALTELLSDESADQISTRAIAERAGVSQPTVYRHFPDRQALLEGLGERSDAAMREVGADGSSFQSLDDIGAAAIRDVAVTEDHAIEATAEALLNADPRRLSRRSRARTEQLHELVTASLPGYSARDHLRITALLRCLYSVQSWLRMREEFGIPGSESGPIMGWAMDTLVAQIRAGNFPRASDA